MTTVTCTTCGARQSLVSALEGNVATDVVKIAASLDPSLAVPLFNYLALWAPAGNHDGMPWSMLERLLKKLVITIERSGHDHALWAAGMMKVLQRRGTLDLPLTSHGYLKKTVSQMADQQAAVAEREKEARLKAGLHRKVAETDQDSRVASTEELGAIASDLRLELINNEQAKELTDMLRTGSLPGEVSARRNAMIQENRDARS